MVVKRIFPCLPYPMNDHPTPLSRRTFLRNSLVTGTLGGCLPRIVFADLDKSGDRDKIVLLGDSRVHRTAREELVHWVEKAARCPWVVGTVEEARRHGFPAAGASLSAEDATGDGFEVLPFDGKLWILGASPSGMLQGALTVSEEAALTGMVTSSFRRVGRFCFRQRIFHARFDGWPGERSDVRYLAHLGASHCLVSHDWQGSRRSLQGYVTSPLFPDAVDAAEVATNHQGLRTLLNHCSDYGLGAMLWLTELPCQGGPWVPQARREKFLTRYSSEVLSDSGTYQGKVLCFGHCTVQAYYQDLMTRFFQDFPEIETLFVFGRDSSGEFCDPQTCPRCRGLSAFQQRNRLLNFLIREGKRVRPGLRVLTTGWGWDFESDEFLSKQKELPAESGVYYAAQKDGWQCERQQHRFMSAVRDVCRSQGQTFIGYDNLHWGDDSVHKIGDIQDFPLGIAAKIKRWRSLEVDGVFDHWGTWGEDVSSNSLACRAFFLQPESSPEDMCGQLASRQFGGRAGPHVLAAWKSLEQAHVILSDACTWSPLQWPMWYRSRDQIPRPGNFPTEALKKALPPERLSDDGVVFNPSPFAASLDRVGKAWREAQPFLSRAVAHLRDAERNAGTEALSYAYWWSGAVPAPDRATHLRRQRLYVESIQITGQEIGLQFELHALWEKCSPDVEAYRKEAAGLLQQDREACLRAAQYFSQLGKPAAWPAQYTAKADGIARYLSEAAP